MPRIRLAAQLSTITLDTVLSGDTCEPISLADFEAYLTYQEHTPENLRFVVWYQDYRRRFFALPPDIQRLSPGPGAQDFDFALPTPARIARRVGRMPPSAEDACPREDGAAEPLSPTSSIQTQGAYDASLLGAPLTPTSTAPLLRKTPFGPALRFARPPRHCRPAPTLCAPPASGPSTPLTGPSLPSPALVPCAPAMQPFRAEVAAVAHTFLLPCAPAEICLPALLRTRVLLDLARNTHPDVLMPVYEAAYDALRGTSLPSWLKTQEENIGWEKKLYWWAYGALTTLVGWAVVCGCVLGAGVRREWRLWAVPFLCLGGMQMYAGYRGFCTQIWGRGGMQLRPWELEHPAHITLVDHSADSDDSEADPRGRRKRSSTLSSTASSEKGVEQSKDKVQAGVIEVACLKRDGFAGDEERKIVEEQREQDTEHGTEDTPDPKSAVLSTASDPAATLSRPIARPHPRFLSRLAIDHTPPRASPHATPAVHAQADGYRDEWAVPPPASDPCAPASPSTPTAYALGIGPRGRLSLSARVFGPERVVLDPRIRAVHRRAMRDILAAGFVWGAVFTVVVLVLPHRH